jgi:hypothetical protein
MLSEILFFPIENKRKYKTIKKGSAIKVACRISDDRLKNRKSAVNKAVQPKLVCSSFKFSFLIFIFENLFN